MQFRILKKPSVMNHVLQLRLRAMTLLLLLFVVMGAAIPAKALPVLTVSPLSGTQKMAIRLTGLHTSGQLRVTDTEGGILYEETVTAGSSYQKVLNLQGLFPGRYALNIDTGQEEIVQPFTITRSGLHCDPAACRTFQAPDVKVQGRFLEVNWLLSGQEKVLIQLQRTAGDIVYETYIPAGDQRLARKFDLTSLPVGNYILSLSQQGKSWTQAVNLQ